MATQTITWFAETTGMARETVKKRLDAAGLVARVWAGMTGACRSHLLAMPYRFMLAAQSANCPAAVEGAARNLIFEALENISAYDPADYAAEPAQPDR